MNQRNEPFAWMLVTNETNCVGFGTAYMCGTWAECARYQLMHGMRGSTAIVYTG